ncbi:putative integral membrane protein [Babesia bovis T2Bo]|uniref:Membrane protein, putative n=1 Tax=Babesia bovis TaxID=5865 RepID=A7AMH2_BABBO|nr:putative integral membrane protein [Babesia bovis T2Bo]EDO07756.1 putative integral membrane protein [Babesia bovis T2Bo]|eukprot:XP_001611324.1 membrane protein [Babesia bovis T2Bo]
MFHIGAFGAAASLRAAVSRVAPSLGQCRPKIGVRSISTNAVSGRDAVSGSDAGAVKLYAPYVIKEVKPPQGGSPIYWSARRKLFRVKTKIMLYTRQLRWNICYMRMAFAGVPKHSYDPKINQWVTIMDNEEWGGIGGRLWVDISNYIMFNFLLAFILYASVYRLIVNNKHNVFAKWARAEEEDGDDE